MNYRLEPFEGTVFIEDTPVNRGLVAGLDAIAARDPLPLFLDTSRSENPFAIAFELPDATRPYDFSEVHFNPPGEHTLRCQADALFIGCAIVPPELSPAPEGAFYATQIFNLRGDVLGFHTAPPEINAMLAIYGPGRTTIQRML